MLLITYKLSLLIIISLIIYIYIYDISIYRNLLRIGIHRIIDSLIYKYTFLGDRVIYILFYLRYRYRYSDGENANWIEMIVL